MKQKVRLLLCSAPYIEFTSIKSAKVHQNVDNFLKLTRNTNTVIGEKNCFPASDHGKWNKQNCCAHAQAKRGKTRSKPHIHSRVGN